MTDWWDAPIRVPFWDGDQIRELTEEEYDQFTDELVVVLNKLNDQMRYWHGHTTDRESSFRADDHVLARCAWLISRSAGGNGVIAQYLMMTFCQWNRDTGARNVVKLFNWDDGDIANACRALFLARWFGYNSPAVCIDEKSAAVLALTHVPNPLDGDEDLKTPWDAFIVRFPPNMVPSDRGPGRYYTHIEVHLEADPIRRWFFTAVDSGGSMLQRCVRRFWDFAKAEKYGMATPPMKEMRRMLDEAGLEEDAPFEEQMEVLGDALFTRASREDRVRTLTLGRIVVNAAVFMTIQGTLTKREPRKQKGVPAWRRLQKQPQTTEYILLPNIPVTFDLAPAVKAVRESMISGKPGLLQWIVRGHWRRQACGTALTERKYTWIAPYWKGKSSARRAIREHEMRLVPETT